MLEVRNISKTYPGEDYGAVNNVSLSIVENQIIALVGKSGSGKSTMLQIIAGLMKPDQGEVLFKGIPLQDPDEQLIAGHPKIKVVFQDFQLKPNMSVEENIRYKLLHFDKEYQMERTAELLALCNISELAARMPKELSGGQKQRLSIARALADDPELLLMDEPFSNLDPLTKQDLLIELVDIVKSENLGLIFVTHDTRDAMLVADRVAFLSEGEMIQNDTVPNIYQSPKNLEVAKFFGRVNDVASLTNKANAYVRAECIGLGAQFDYQRKVRLQKSIFLGGKYLIEAFDEDNQELYFLYSDAAINIQNGTFMIGFNDAEILRF
ncbi:ABC transporter ATP-binding protein [Roseivirga sp. E12]|uniref:ABC transporter ATP-binding protein n=1 Tax=Roseivirga sp. E12 TaxID=2819237 RepID=UPI001ABBE8E5|nr:ABC transporter ATP-binding protein [Roseivirga sp. E12]MBO3697641.1 ABC transporter ATP-binding protein [Roseivirga sp. E12]